MKTLFTIILISSFFTTTVDAQNYTFKVLASKGKIEVKSVNDWQSIKVGASLNPTDQVKIAEDSYLGLIHANGRPLEMREAGSFKVSELVSRLGTGSSVLNKYTDFILSSEEQKRNRLSATGAVHRGLKDVIVVYLPGTEKAELYGDYIGLQWSSDEVKGPYDVVFSNLLEDELARYTTTENHLIVSMNEGTLKGAHEVIVKVVSKEVRGKGSKEYMIKKLRPTDREKFKKALNEIEGALDNTALSKYILAGFFEENFLLNDALTAYQEAIKLAPDVALYSEAYREFLRRMGFEIK